jgi:hypothetical protein
MHDWEFSLNPGARATGASGAVQVTEGDPENRFAVQVTGLPPVDSLDQEGRDVSAYTVWVVPSKDRVRESTLAGTLEVDATGAGRFEGTTSLDTFGIAILATAEGTTTPVGVPALTGIPVTEAEPPAETPAAETPTETPTPETPAPETPEALEPPPPAPADTLEPQAPADEVAPEAPPYEAPPDTTPGAESS